MRRACAQALAAEEPMSDDEDDEGQDDGDAKVMGTPQGKDARQSSRMPSKPAAADHIATTNIMRQRIEEEEERLAAAQKMLDSHFKQVIIVLLC